MSSGLLAVALWTVGGVSRADGPTDQCIGANAKAQWLRQAGKLAEAREQLQSCAEASCPAMVRDDCVQRLDELERAQPTIAFDVKDSSGNDVSAVAVTVDGRRLVDRLDGRAVAVDSGEHTFTFTIAGQSPASRTLLLHEGEKGRREHVVLPAPAQASRPQVAAEPSPEGPHPSPWRAIGLATAGVGVVGLGVGAALGIVAMNKKGDAGCDSNSVCPTSSSADTLSDAKSAANASTAFFIVGGVLAASGVSLWLLAPGSAVQAAATVGDRSAGLVLRGVW
jgi:hypothetical protein